VGQNRRVILGAAFLRVLAGDVSAMSEIEATGHDELSVAVVGVRSILTAQAVCRAIQMSLPGGCSDIELQHWASFVKRGYVGGLLGPIRPMDIEYELDQEETIAEIVGRMDELGDIVDGEISLSERMGWLDRLACTPGIEEPRQRP
jgi:hypothetical protein